jgi:hypothetical protein
MKKLVLKWAQRIRKSRVNREPQRVNFNTPLQDLLLLPTKKKDKWVKNNKRGLEKDREKRFRRKWGRKRADVVANNFFSFLQNLKK